MTKKNAKAIIWLCKYSEYFYTDTSDPDTPKFMAKPDAPSEAVESFNLWKKINGLTY